MVFKIGIVLLISFYALTIQQIVAIIPPSDAIGQNCLAWKWMEKDGFSSSEAYKNLFSQVSDDVAIWKMIWRIPEPQMLEIGIHAFRDCTFAKTLWQIVVPRQAHNIFFSLSMKEWNIKAIVDTSYMWARSYRDLDVQMKSLGTIRRLSSWTSLVPS
ncbi:hypothetical protein J1N35_000677 [Gossypium stocksii]|uniref:Reverse transcriptase zinc-binding domain-containing protein n=1 Tax=Gossypium stocksii TaxID=47602 RepID=A0A9D3WIJ7_9ROSI|nr:hypothetical protein J1N35_000677 [Gossypium stocksii]